jgi:hypothetical protein
MLVYDSLQRKPGFDSMVPPDGIRIGHTGTKAALVQNPGRFPYQMLLHQFSILSYYPTQTQQAFWMWWKHETILPHTYKQVI